ncbi:hypothetical protein KVR01_006193 [Diaporthe batatas]|uniref:uncharacterized protein n=1 Tax=Diaporthe batatas TaxID=748121 RepID=UPI001D040FD2|nr:uncharacterized protein KVR01_006193 [Diaporthe batatas]KAG8164275.1 hypothetical protein KVR01_006193 [Diaporthe batatas]
MGRILFPVWTAAVSAVAAYATTSPSNHPDINSAHENAFAIFNSIHSAMRQWGSSVNHNGLSFYLATAPEGSIFYHGGFSPDRPDSFEWLAFEVEHAAQFAASWEFTQDPSLQIRSGSTGFNETAWKALLSHRRSHARPASDATYASPIGDGSFSQRPMATVDDDGDDDGDKDPQPSLHPPFDELWRGYFHVYRANRPLNLLYIDGQAAAKGPLGPQDSQDLILLGHAHPGPGAPTYGEWPRAEGLCDLAGEWPAPGVGGGARIDGFIRMECGFEIIYCDFSERGGLDRLSVQSSSFSNETGLAPYQVAPAFEWMRACAARFHGLPAGRVDVDWSSMVSAYFYPVNISNPDPHRRDLPRLANATLQSRLGVRDRLRDVFAARGGEEVPRREVVNWQGVVDSIVTRFSGRLGYIASSRWSHDGLLLAVGTILDPYISYTDRSPASEQRAVDRCARHYLDPSALRPETWTPEDHAIAAAVERVSRDICDSLFVARRILRASRGEGVDLDPLVEEAQQTIVELTERLRWSTWRECGRCPSPDEICSIPMFPMGVSEEDYFHPSCKNISALMQDFSYWQREFHIPG